MADSRRVRRVKVVATLGPASSAPGGVLELAIAGVNCFRLNAAHLRPEEIGPLLETVRGAEGKAGRPLGVFCDLAGPKLRIAGRVGSITLAEGAQVSVGNRADSAEVVIGGLDPVHECPPGSRILIHDGKVSLRVTATAPDHVVAEVLRGGEVAGEMGVNLPDVETSLPSLTDADLRALESAIAAGVDAVSLSFVRRAEDIVGLRSRMRALGRVVPIIAKLEKAQAVRPDSLAAILAATDLVMVARGDLGAETAPEEVPVLQKRILRAARSVGVPTITATEMLESMIHEPRPTRAEAADVANAVFDGSDAVMLSAETAVGRHPALTVEVCTRIIEAAESHPEFRTAWAEPPCGPETRDPVSDAVAEAAAAAADQLAASGIVCFTGSGKTARLVARHRPQRPVLALTPRVEVARWLSLVWGIQARVVAVQPDDHEAIVRLAEQEAVREGLAESGELIVVTHGAPLAARPLTNVMRVHRVD